MKRIFPLLLTVAFFLMPAFQNESTLNAQVQTSVKGIVYHDKNENAVYDADVDEPLEDVAVSNGYDVVVTDRDGEYEIPLRNDAAVFVIKPRNWTIPVDEENIPRFYKMYSATGVSGTKFEGLEATGLPPESVDFPLYPAEEPGKVKALVFGDTQPRDDKEIHFMSEDVIPELVGADADFGVTLGDVVFDDLSIYDHLTGSLSNIGIPMWYVAGNHDFDFTGNNTTEARGTWFNTFGPSYYSFSYGPAHFIVLDNIRWIVEEDDRYYRTGLGEAQMEFLKNEMERLDENQLLVLLVHIPYEGSTPWEDETEKEAFYELLSGHKNSVSLVAHTHRHYHHFIGKEEGFPGNEPHHMISMGTVCGAWWTGAPDEYGIPHTMMSDGTPNGYGFLHIDGNDWKLQWKTAGVPENVQMHIAAPEAVNAEDGTFKVIANIYNALPDADLKMKIGEDGEWIAMKRVPQKDPVRLAEKERENQLGEVPWR
ncbi:MAG: calcineurin-like phosphoesterase C-terminal domain-containing protein, partial [Tangfeifania sp.]